MQFILTPVGSSGDVHPFVGMGRLLRERGHEVVVVSGEPFRDVVERAGLRFHATHSVDEFNEMTRNPDLWHPTRGLPLILRAGAGVLRRDYARIAEVCHDPRQAVLVGHTLSFAARVFEEMHPIGAATVHLAPSVFRSDFVQPTYIPGRNLSRMPRWLKRGFWWMADRLLVDRHIAPELNRWRGELGLQPVSRVFRHWLHSPQRVIGLFPPWFGAPQPDWPPALRLAGFPLYDESDQHMIPDDVRRFLESGAAPIVFTPGSANQTASAFFDTAVGAAERLGRRALLLTRYRGQLPSRLPASSHHAAYVPLSQILPRSAALVHHGGIGTCAQGLAAGVPQLTMPMGFDQPDNATRLQGLGVGRWVQPGRFTPHRVASALGDLLENEAVASACRHWAEQIRHARGLEAACDVLERVGDGTTPSTLRP